MPNRFNYRCLTHVILCHRRRSWINYVMPSRRLFVVWSLAPMPTCQVVAIDSRLYSSFVSLIWMRVERGNARMHASADVYARGYWQLHVRADVCICIVLGIETCFPKTRGNASEGIEAGVRALGGELWVALNVSRGTATSIRTWQRIKGACACTGDEGKIRCSRSW